MIHTTMTTIGGFSCAFIVCSQQNPSIHQREFSNRMRDRCLTPTRDDKNANDHLLITSTGLASLQDAGCRGVFSGGIAR